MQGGGGVGEDGTYTCEMVNPRSGCGGLGLEMHFVGIVLACYIIVYGLVQVSHPKTVLLGDAHIFDAFLFTLLWQGTLSMY